MALYVYRCDTCGNEIEQICSVEHRDDPVLCDACGRPRLRIISPSVTWRWIDPTTGGPMMSPSGQPLAPLNKKKGG